MDRQLGKISVALILAVLCLVTAQEIKSSSWRQEDFRVYYSAASSWQQGGDPYYPHLRRLDGSIYIKDSGFIYPPYALTLFRPFLLWEMPRAEQNYLAFHVLAAVLLIWTLRGFLGTLADFWFVPFALLAFNGTLIRDIEQGNIAIFEQLLIWLGFWAFLRGRIGWFCVLVLAGSSLKILPAALLGVLLMRGLHGGLRDRRARWKAASVILGAGLCLGVAWIAQSTLFSEFLHRALAMSGSNERGQINPALFPLVRDLFDLFKLAGWQAPPLISRIVYVACVVLILYCTARAWRRACRHHHADLDRLAVILDCLAFALVMPRMKDYSYVVLLAPAYYVIKTSRSIDAVVPLLLLMVVPVVPTLTTGFGTLTSLAHEYYSYVLALILWIIVCRRLELAPAT